jgi:ankyrin repeat protein
MIAKGAGIDAKDNGCRTPLDLAGRHGHTAIVEQLHRARRNDDHIRAALKGQQHG